MSLQLAEPRRRRAAERVEMSYRQFLRPFIRPVPNAQRHTCAAAVDNNDS